MKSSDKITILLQMFFKQFKALSYVKFNTFQKHKYARLIRLDKPTGIYLTLLPALWAVALAAKTWYALIIYSLIMLIGAVLTRSAGCIINDLFDKDIDSKVIRTKHRPLASGEITHKEAYTILVVLGILSLFLLNTLSTLSIYIGLIAIPMIIVYPLLKRITFYPQIFLGLTFNIGVFIAWFAVSPQFSYQAILLYVASVLWTIGYDTIYGHQDRLYDQHQGVKSLSIKLGDRTANVVWNLYKIMMILIVVAGVGKNINLFFFAMAAFATYYLYWQTATLDINDPKSCEEKFKANVHVGFIIWIGILIGKL